MRADQDAMVLVSVAMKLLSRHDYDTLGGPESGDVIEFDDAKNAARLCLNLQRNASSWDNAEELATLIAKQSSGRLVRAVACLLPPPNAIYSARALVHHTSAVIGCATSTPDQRAAAFLCECGRRGIDALQIAVSNLQGRAYDASWVESLAIAWPWCAKDATGRGAAILKSLALSLDGQVPGAIRASDYRCLVLSARIKLAAEDIPGARMLANAVLQAVDDHVNAQDQCHCAAGVLGLCCLREGNVGAAVAWLKESSRLAETYPRTPHLAMWEFPRALLQQGRISDVVDHVCRLQRSGCVAGSQARRWLLDIERKQDADFGLYAPDDVVLP